MIIEDKTDIRGNTAEILELAGYKTLTAENGKGVEAAFMERPDVVACDIMMPELDGYGYCICSKKIPIPKYSFCFSCRKKEPGDFCNEWKWERMTLSPSSLRLSIC